MKAALERRRHSGEGEAGRQLRGSAGAIGDKRAAATKAEIERRAARLGRPGDWDAVDEASWESFPASDPPSSWAGVDRGGPSTH